MSKQKTQPASGTKKTLLCVDTAQGVASLGLVRDGQVLAEVQLANKRDHAERIIDALDALFDKTGLSLKDCAAIVIGLGPGSFIGVRIGLATIKGLAFGADLPIIGVSSSAALALSAQSSAAPVRVAVAVDAKKAQVYASAYQLDASGIIDEILLEAQPLKPAEAQQRFVDMGPFDLVTGDGFGRYAEVFADLLQGPSSPNVVDTGIQCRALAALAKKKLAQQKFDDIDSLAPHYTRRSEAEIKRAQRLHNKA